MLLQRLHLVNFRQYRQMELRFQDGITGIVGRNGSGKSTILEAVLWCLFGSRAARTGKEGIKRQTASAADDCSVRLEFQLGKDAYCLTRSLIGKNSRSEAILSQQGRLDAITTREVDDYVVRLIGLNLKGFLSSFFARQKELNVLSEARPAERKDHLARMLGVGRLDSAIQMLKEEIKTTRQRIDILSGLQIDPAAVAAELEQKKSEIKLLEEAGASLKEALQKNETDIERQTREIEALRQKEQENYRLENESATLSAQREAIEKEIRLLSSEIAELKDLARNLEPLKNETAGIEALEKAVGDLKKAQIQQEENRRLKSELENSIKASEQSLQQESSLRATAAELKKKLAAKPDMVKDINGLETQIDLMLQEHRELGAEIRVIEDKLATMNKQKAEIAELGPEASCKLCLRPFAGELGEIEKHFDEEIRSLRQQLAPMKKRLEEIAEKGKDYRRDIKEKKDRLEILTRSEQKLASAEADIRGLDSAAKERRKRTAEIEKRLAEIGEIEFDPVKLTQQETALKQKQAKRDEYIRLIEKTARIPQMEVALQKSRDGLEVIAGQLNRNLAAKTALGFDRQVYNDAAARLEKSRAEAAGIRLEIERSDGQIRLLASEAKAREQKLAEYEKSRKEIVVLRENLTYMEKLSILFAEFRVYLIGRIRPALSKRTSQLFHEMTGGRYQEIELDEDYSLRVYDRGEAFTIDRFSGGEIDLANLCFRLAISVEMATTAGIDQSFIILDEIFGSQDAERQRMIFEGLGRLKNRFRQIIIISHIDDVKEMAENIISVEVDRFGISRAVATEN